ncbi:transcriptional regulator QRICH1-like [Branchiostoma lanceolatum]|uniref:transcriptional regulator QRICH1-like n=1 Tax=Branchiostoma lanceolatum TaxID=7740 RepID=UPI0034568B47
MEDSTFPDTFGFSFVDNFLGDIGLSQEEDTQPKEPLQSFPAASSTFLSPVSSTEPGFADTFLDQIGITLEEFQTQPDPFTDPPPLQPSVNVPMASTDLGFADTFLGQIGITLEEFQTQPDPFTATSDPPPLQKPTLKTEDTGASSSSQFTTSTDPRNDSSSTRYASPMSTAMIQEKVKGRVPKATQRSTKYGTTVWNDWALNRNQRLSNFNTVLGEVSEPFIIVPTELKHASHAEMDFWLTKFIFEIRKIDGEPYPPATLYSLVSGLMRHFREDLNRHDMNFLDRKDIRFAEFRKALDARMKELTSAGVGVKKKQADPLTPDDEDRLWQSNAISLSTSQGLSYGVYFYNCKIFGLRAMDEHQRLMLDQYKVGTDTNGHYMQYTGRVSKNVQGGLQQRNVSVKDIKQHADPTNPRCVVHLFETYIRALPEKSGRFYRRPLKSEVPKFSLQPVGVNKLGAYF